MQCKQWRAQQVPVTVVRELYGVMAVQQDAGGYVVTSGRFTRDAVAFAQGRNIELIDGTRLQKLLRKPSNTTAASATPMTSHGTTTTTVPSCPRCKEPMIARIAKRGAHAGNEFWGCPHYPKCHEIVVKTSALSHPRVRAELARSLRNPRVLAMNVGATPAQEVSALSPEDLNTRKRDVM